MATIELRHVFLLILISTGVKCWLTKNTCDETFSLSCAGGNVPFIHVLNVNSSKSLAKELLEKCMAHSVCVVPNPEKECIEITYWCHTVRQRMEIKVFSKTQLIVNLMDSTELSLMSHGYSNGEYQDGQNVFCNIKEQYDYNHCSATMDFYIREFSPFISSTDYCLALNSAEPPICSGSQDFGSSHARPHLYTKLTQTFNFTLSKGISEIPKVRFWIAVNIKRHMSRNRACIVKLECDSRPVNFGLKHEVKDCAAETKPFNETAAMKDGPSKSNKLIPVLAFFCGLSILLAATFTWAMIKIRRLASKVPKTNRGHLDEAIFVTDEGHPIVQFPGTQN